MYTQCVLALNTEYFLELCENNHRYITLYMGGIRTHDLCNSKRLIN